MLVGLVGLCDTSPKSSRRGSAKFQFWEKSSPTKKGFQIKNKDRESRRSKKARKRQKNGKNVKEMLKAKIPRNVFVCVHRTVVW